MDDIDPQLYEIMPAYRKLVDALRRLDQEFGAVTAAYHNACQERDRAWTIIGRNDPGRGGSGGV